MTADGPSRKIDPAPPGGRVEVCWRFPLIDGQLQRISAVPGAKCGQAACIAPVYDVPAASALFCYGSRG
jgi:hypothetical protein